MSEDGRTVVAGRSLPKDYPTNFHAPEFWEALGRTVATFGFLEEVLGKAIFAFTGTREIPPETAEAEFAKWLPTLERALSDPLGGLIGQYEKAVRANSRATITNLDGLAADLRAASAVRNALCHGSWRMPDAQGRSLPLFVTKDQKIFSDPVDVAYLDQVRAFTANLTLAVLDSVAAMGVQFPGANGPGRPVLSGR